MPKTHMFNETNQLTSETIITFQTAFGKLHDAVVLSVFMDFFSPTNPYRQFTIVLDAKIVSTAIPDQWAKITFTFEDIVQFELQKGWNYDFSVILEANFDFFEGYTCIDFSPHVVSHKSLDDVTRLSGTKGPMFIIVSKRCFWHALLYTAIDT